MGHSFTKLSCITPKVRTAKMQRLSWHTAIATQVLADEIRTRLAQVLAQVLAR